jgi:hypothetical protein
MPIRITESTFSIESVIVGLAPFLECHKLILKFNLAYLLLIVLSNILHVLVYPLLSTREFTSGKIGFSKVGFVEPLFPSFLRVSLLQPIFSV